MLGLAQNKTGLNVITFSFSKDCDDDYKIGKRVSMDHTVNSAGEILLDVCISTGLRILNGRHGNDSNTGKFTCNTYRDSSVVDYVPTEPQLFSLISCFDVASPSMYADHCLLSFKFHISQVHNSRAITVNNSTKEPSEIDSVIFDRSKLHQFQEDISLPVVLFLLKERILHQDIMYYPQIFHDTISSIGHKSGALKGHHLC